MGGGPDRAGVAGALLSAAGWTGLTLLALSFSTGGQGPLVFALFMGEFVLPTLVALIAAARTGRRLTRGRAESNVPAALAAAAVAACGGFWAWFWVDIDPLPVWYAATALRVDIASGLVAAVGLLSTVAFLLLVRRPRLRRPAFPTAKAAIAAGVVIVVTVAMADLLIPRADLTAAGPGCSPPSIGNPPLANLDYGWPDPPLPPGARVVAAALAPQVPQGDADGEAGLPYGDRGLLVYLRVPSYDDVVRGLSAAASLHGFRLSDSGRSSFNDAPTSRSWRYEGHGVYGTVVADQCDGGWLVTVDQQVRADRVGVCHPPSMHGRCATLYTQARSTLALVEQVPPDLPTGPRDPRPTMRVEPGGRLALRAARHTYEPPFFYLQDLDDGFLAAGWHRVAVTCRARCFDPDMFDEDTRSVAYARAGFAATLRVRPYGEHNSVVVADWREAGR